MEWIMMGVGVLGVLSLGYFFYSYLFGYNKGNIVLTLDEHYTSLDAYVPAILSALYEQGKTAHYVGDRKFQVEGKTYVLVERVVPIGRVPTQQTVLQPVK